MISKEIWLLLKEQRVLFKSKQIFMLRVEKLRVKRYKLLGKPFIKI